MMLVYCVCMLFIGALGFQQNEYVIDFYRAEIPFFDKAYIGYASASTYKYNRTQAAVNASFQFKFDPDNDIDMVAQAYKFMSNEYREFPLRFSFNFCTGLKENHFGMGDFYKCGNFPKCPMKKGDYYLAKWIPDSSKFPPLIPNGKYQLALDMVYHSKKIMLINAFAEIKRPHS